MLNFFLCKCLNLQTPQIFGYIYLEIILYYSDLIYPNVPPRKQHTWPLNCTAMCFTGTPHLTITSQNNRRPSSSISLSFSIYDTVTLFWTPWKTRLTRPRHSLGTCFISHSKNWQFLTMNLFISLEALSFSVKISNHMECVDKR